MVGLQFQSMSIRRVCKKQTIHLVNEEEERAKEKLFEISYFDDQRQLEDSRALLPHTWWHKQLPADPKPLRIKTTREVQKKKSQSLGPNLDDTSSIQNLSAHKVQKTLQLDLPPQPSLIFNTIESNSVFVGNKNAFINSARPYMPEKILLQKGKKRRIETMPAIKQRSQMKFAKEDSLSLNKFQIEWKTPKQRPYRGQIPKLSGLIPDKNGSYVKLKYKIKRDILNSLEQRMTTARRLPF